MSASIKSLDVSVQPYISICPRVTSPVTKIETKSLYIHQLNVSGFDMHVSFYGQNFDMVAGRYLQSVSSATRIEALSITILHVDGSVTNYES